MSPFLPILIGLLIIVAVQFAWARWGRTKYPEVAASLTLLGIAAMALVAGRVAA